MGPAVASFVGGPSGGWQVLRIDAIAGPTLPAVGHLAVYESLDVRPVPTARWILRGATSHEQYVEPHERDELERIQPPLGRPRATCAALIPIRKSEDWWKLPRDDRRQVFEERSRHIATGLRYLPAVARRLYHARHLGEPFDFLTWFEFAPEDAAAFDELLEKLRRTEEWSYVEREVEIRLRKRRTGAEPL